MTTRKELAIEARANGLKQFVCSEIPCAKCGCVTFFTAGGGRCKDCLYRFTKSKRATSDGQEREKISRKKSYDKYYSVPENRKKKAEKDKEYIRKVKADPGRRKLFLEKKRIIYRKWYYSENGNVKALQNAKQWMVDNPHHRLLRKSLERMDIKIGSILSDSSIDEVLGYSKNEFISYIQSTMEPWMSFDDRSTWHIDHVLSVDWFVKKGLLYPELVNCLHNLKAESADYNFKKNNLWLRNDITEWDWCYMLQWMVYGEIRYKEGG